MKVCVIQAMYLDMGGMKNPEKMLERIRDRLKLAFGGEVPPSFIRFGAYSLAVCDKEGYPKINMVVRAKAQKEKR